MPPAFPSGTPDDLMTTDTKPDTATANPLLADWTAPFGLPPFGEIEPWHWEPAFETALASARHDIDAIAENPEAPDFDNTIAAMERAGRDLTRVAMVFFNLAGSHTSEELRRIERDMAPGLPATPRRRS